MSYDTTIAVINLSGETRIIPSVGYEVLNNATQDLFADSDNDPNLVFSDEVLRGWLAAGEFAIYFESEYTLSVDDSLRLWDTRFTFPKRRVTNAPGATDDASKGITEGNEFYATATSKNYTCTSDAVGAATYDEEAVV